MVSVPVEKLIRMVRSPLVFPLCVYTLVFLSIQILEVPFVRLFEQAICNRYYRTISVNGGHRRDIDERRCKISIVQDRLTTVASWKYFFDAVPGVLTAVSYGTLADRYSPQLVISLSITGLALASLWNIVICQFDNIFPVQLIWLSSVFLFIGGGQRIFSSMIYILVSDSFEHSSRYAYPIASSLLVLIGETERTKNLYLLAAGPQTNRFTAPQIAAALMNVNLYAPFWLSVSIQGACLVIVNTKKQIEPNNSRHKYTVVVSSEPTSLRAGNPDVCSTPSSPRSPSPEYSHVSEARRKLWVWSEDFIRSLRTIRILFKSPASRFCLVAFFIKRIAFTSESFVFQYASEKFSWPLQQTTWLRVASAAGAVFATLVAWPIATLTFKRDCHSYKVDLNAVRASLVIVALSFFWAWRATSGVELALVMIGCGLGEGMEPALQGFLTYLSDSAQNAQLFTTIAIPDSLGELMGGPLTGAVMAIGRRPGRPSAGLCFLASSLMFVVLALWSSFVRVKR